MRKRIFLLGVLAVFAVNLPVFEPELEAGEDQDTLSDLFEGKADAWSDREMEEAEILWKLGERKKALRSVERLLEKQPDNLRVLGTASAFYLGEGKTGKARPLIEALESREGLTPTVLELKGDLLSQQEKWKEAGKAYEALLQSSPGNRRYQESYVNVLSALRRWPEALALYRKLLRENPKTKGLLSNYLSDLEVGAAQFGTSFEYFHRPATERDYHLKQKGSFWFAPWLRMGVGLAEDFFFKKARVLPEGTHRRMMGHSLEAQFYYARDISFLTRWVSTYYDNRDVNELDFIGEFKKGPLQSRAGYQWNILSEDPVEALEKRGTIDRLHADNSLTFWDRLKGGHDISVEWYRMDASRNDLTHTHYLGYKTTNDFFTELIVWRNPYLSINYHYKYGVWNRAFPDAEQEIGYLVKEIVHYGGLYLEQRIGPYVSANGSVTRGSDRKRHVDFVIWTFRGDFWLSDRAKLSCAYEYDYGDSGTAGRGNTQVFSGSVHVYF